MTAAPLFEDIRAWKAVLPFTGCAKKDVLLKKEKKSLKKAAEAAAGRGATTTTAKSQQHQYRVSQKKPLKKPL